MSYELAFVPEAAREWKDLDGSVKQLFKKQLQKCLDAPRIPKNLISGHEDYYKIKLTRPQYRLVYHIDDSRKRVTVIAVASRDDIYASLKRRSVKELRRLPITRSTDPKTLIGRRLC